MSAIGNRDYKSFESVYDMKECLIGLSKHPEKQGSSFFLIQKKTEKIVPLHQIETGLPFQEIAPLRLKKILLLTFPKLVELSDGSYKLYIHMSGRGGGCTEPEDQERAQVLGISDKSDVDLADAIIRNMPPRTYSSVTVSTLPAYQFAGESLAKETRQIEIKLGSWEFFCNLIQSIARESETINNNRMVQAILGSTDEQGQRHVRESYQRNTEIKIYISKDLLSIEIKPTSSVATEHVQGFGQWVRNSCVIS